jgi:hypothetical protein
MTNVFSLPIFLELRTGSLQIFLPLLIELTTDEFQFIQIFLELRTDVFMTMCADGTIFIDHITDIWKVN